MAETGTRCQECGGLLDEEDLFCSNCGLSAPVASTPLASPLQGETPTHYFSCTGCGASMSYDASAGTLRCPFCGSSHLKAEATDVKTLKATLVVPFSVQRQQAQHLLRAWLAQGFWRPTQLATEAVVTKMSPVYAPYWRFSASTFTYWTADVAKGWGGGRGDWRPVTGSHRGSYSGILIGASAVLTQQETTDLCPFDLNAAQDTNEIDLQNVTVEQFTVPRKYARPLARQSIEDQERSTCGGQYLQVQFRNLRVNVRIRDMCSEPLLLPIWIAAYRYRGQRFRTLINGQTGRIIGQAPFSWTKLAVVVGLLLLAVLIALLANLR